MPLVICRWKGKKLQSQFREVISSVSVNIYRKNGDAEQEVKKLESGKGTSFKTHNQRKWGAMDK
jgi:hypothetical protein